MSLNSRLSDLTRTYCETAGLGPYSRPFSTNRLTIRSQMVENLDSSQLFLATARQARQPASSRNTEQGFTLLEVMIALVIIGIALIACLTLVNRCIYSHEQVQRITTATMLAQHKMSELEAESRTGELSHSTQKGNWAEPYDQFHWQVDFNDTLVSGVQQVTVSIIWGERQRNEEVSIDSFLFNK